MSKIIRFLILVIVIYFSAAQKLRIPDRVLYCYRGNLTESWNPQSLSFVIEIIRKIENRRSTSLDLKQLSTRLFHDLRIDGIYKFPFQESEDVTPYSRAGFMAYKNIVLRRLVSNMPGEIDYENILSTFEFCALHKALSSSVEPFERKDELRHCPRSILNGTRRNEQPTLIIPRARDPSVHHRFPANFSIVPPMLSRCPIETGIVTIDTSGTNNNIHPGVVIANIAAGLQPQNVKIGEFILSEMRMRDAFENLETMEITDNRQKISKLISSLSSVDNTYAAGLAGDLAEIVIHQGALGNRNFSIGFDGSWNDTEFPRNFYMNGNRIGLWHLTDAEILSGIDGLFFSQQVAAWTSRIRRLRLSQVLEMFYYHRGIEIPLIESSTNRKIYKGRTWRKDEKNEAVDDSSFDSKKIFRRKFELSKSELIDVNLKYLSRMSIVTDVTKACHRKRILELINVEKLKEETLSFVQILEVETSAAFISPNMLKILSNRVVDEMMDYARELIEGPTTPECHQNLLNQRRTAVDLTIIIDGSRTAYENLRLIHSVAELIDVSSFGSYISVIHGATGEFLANRTNSLSNLFEQLRNSSHIRNPIRLSLLNSFSSLMFQLVDQTTAEKESGIYGALPKVCLVVSQLHRISEMDFDSAQYMLRGSMKQFPDLYFVFLSNDVNTFKEMVVRNDNNTSSLVNEEDAERYQFVSSDSIEFSRFRKSLDVAFQSIPKRIVSPYCKLSPDEKRTWEDILRREEFEDYLTPHEDMKYRISSTYFGTEDLSVKFQGVGYGDFTVCMARTSTMDSKTCQSVVDIDYVWFNISQPCTKSEQKCSSIYFTLSADTTALKCSESDCRFPDNVRVIIRPEGLRCERNGNGRLTAINFSMLISSYLILSSFFTH